MKVLSLFSGIGAFEKALDRQGIDYELVGFSEIDKYAIDSYCAIHKVDKSMNLGDITKIDTETLPKDIDLITYGFPCQDISLAGKQKGLFNEDGTQTRSGLFFEALRLIEDTQPKVAIAENVKNLTGKTFQLQFEIVLNSLEEAGYNNYWKVLNAKDFGIPQNRERVFIVSIRKDIDTGGFQFPQEFPLEVRLKDVLEAEVDKKYYLEGKYENITKINENYYMLNGGTIGKLHDITRRAYNPDYIAPSMHTCGGGNTEPKVAIKPICLNSKGGRGGVEGLQPSLQDRVYDSNGVSTAVTTSYMPSFTDVDDIRIRKLTPRECFRLMDFDDEDFDACLYIGMSNAQLYKQAGNSIVVAVAYYIIQSLIESGVFEHNSLCGSIWASAEKTEELEPKVVVKLVEEKISESSDKTESVEYTFDPNKLIDFLLRENIITVKEG